MCKEIADKILEVNGGPPSALFLAGGGSKLVGLKDKITEVLQMDTNRVAIAGNNFKASAFSEEYDLNNPEYATPLGITISSGLNLINDSFRVILNDNPAKLFRSGKLSDVIHAGDCIDFVPAVSGVSAKACLGDIEGALSCLDITLNGAHVSLKTPLKNGDIILMKLPEKKPLKEDGTSVPEETGEEISAREADPAEPVSEAEEEPEAGEITPAKTEALAEEAAAEETEPVKEPPAPEPEAKRAESLIT